MKLKNLFYFVTQYQIFYKTKNNNMNETESLVLLICVNNKIKY